MLDNKSNAGDSPDLAGCIESSKIVRSCCVTTRQPESPVRARHNTMEILQGVKENRQWDGKGGSAQRAREQVVKAHSHPRS